MYNLQNSIDLTIPARTKRLNPNPHSPTLDHSVTPKIRNCSQLLANLRRSSCSLFSQLRSTSKSISSFSIDIERAAFRCFIRIQRKQCHDIQSQERNNCIKIFLPSVRVRSRETCAAGVASSQGPAGGGVDGLCWSCESDSGLDSRCEFGNVCAADSLDNRARPEDHECRHTISLSAAKMKLRRGELTL